MAKLNTVQWSNSRVGNCNASTQIKIESDTVNGNSAQSFAAVKKLGPVEFKTFRTLKRRTATTTDSGNCQRIERMRRRRSNRLGHRRKKRNILKGVEKLNEI